MFGLAQDESTLSSTNFVRLCPDLFPRELDAGTFRFVSFALFRKLDEDKTFVDFARRSTKAALKKFEQFLGRPDTPASSGANGSHSDQGRQETRDEFGVNLVQIYQGEKSEQFLEKHDCYLLVIIDAENGFVGKANGPTAV